MDMSPGTLFSSMIISTVGFSIFIYGKKQTRVPQVIAGLAMMAYPFFITNVAWMLGVAVGVIGGLFLAVRAGY